VRTCSDWCVPANFVDVKFSYGLNKKKAIPVTGRGGPESCETSKLPNFLHDRLTDGGEVVSLMRQPPFTPQEDSWYSLLLEAESTPGT
jgi:hypothetical protein